MPRFLLLLPLLVPGAWAANLRYAEDQAPAIVNPLFGSTMAEARVNELIFDGLYTDDPELATVPALAASAELSPDRTEMTITLREGVQWQDGTPLRAADVVFTIQAMQDRGTLSTEAGRVSWIKEATADGELTVHLRFGRPEARPEDKLLFKILPAHAFTGLPVKRTDAFRSNPVGTGPWQLTHYNDDNSITFTANGAYRKRVGISQLTMREVSDKNYQAKLLLYESLEALVRVLPRDLAMLQNNRKVELYPYQTNSWWYVGFNLQRAPFSDPLVRKAIASSVDLGALLAPVGTGDLLTGPFVKSSPFYNHEVPAWEYDGNTATAALTEAGWARTGDTWMKGGKPLTINITAHQALESAQEVAINLQSQLQSAGIKANVEFLDEAAWKSRVWRDRDFDVLLSQWTFDRNEDIREQFHSKGSRNFCGYADPEVDGLLDKARDTLDPYVKKSTLRDVHRRIHDANPMLFLWSLDSYAAMSVKVKGVVIHPFYFFSWASDWQMK
jgi:peptide/nickel transport system substrate-binding protein